MLNENKIPSPAEWFFAKENNWQAAYSLLRQICLSTPLNEDLKWGCPCYTLNGKNIVLIHGFKNYCALLFMKGVLFDDPNKLLIQQTPNVQHARQLRFSSVEEISKQENQILQFINQAIHIEQKGIMPEFKSISDKVTPREFEKILQSNPALNEAFCALSQGRQRAYQIYFSSAKQIKTREARIEKYISKILAGKGLNDN